MNYIEIVNLVFQISYGIFSLLSICYAIFFVAGIFKKKTFKKAKVTGKYGIVITARNEDNVINNLIESIKNTNYPQENLTIFVLAHNCIDLTAKVARDAGCIVYEYNNDKERTKGFGLKYIFEQIKKDYGINSFDGYFIFDADNIVSSNYFDKMNDAFMYYKKNNIVASFRNSKNFGKGIIPGLYGIYFASGCFFESRGRTVCNCSTRVTGTGYVIPSTALENGWNYVTLTEDWELTADQIIAGHKVGYCEDAIFYDEQPTTIKMMWRQRVRWKRGHYLVFYYRFKDIVKNLFSRKKNFKVSLYDIAYNIAPMTMVFLSLTLIKLLLVSIAPLFIDISYYQVFIDYNYNSPWYMNLIFNQSYLLDLSRTLIIGYCSTAIMAILCFIALRKRIRHVNFFLKIALILIWPFFLGIQFIIDIHALFVRNLEWKTIPHKDKTNISSINKSGNQM